LNDIDSVTDGAQSALTGIQGFIEKHAVCWWLFPLFQ
jgi:hypothetical protein